jgi:hypothetical protein
VHGTRAIVDGFGPLASKIKLNRMSSGYAITASGVGHCHFKKDIIDFGRRLAVFFYKLRIPRTCRPWSSSARQEYHKIMIIFLTFKFIALLFK